MLVCCMVYAGRGLRNATPTSCPAWNRGVGCGSDDDARSGRGSQEFNGCCSAGSSKCRILAAVRGGVE